MKLLNLDFNSDLKKQIKDNVCFETLQKLKLPNKSIEEFKRFDLNDIYETPYNLNYTSYSSIDPFEYLKMEGFYYIFISNSQFLPQHSCITEDVTFCQHQKNHNPSNNALYYLSETFLEQQNQINIIASLDKPLLIVNLFKSDNSFVPTSLNINMGNRCKADVVELFLSQNSGECFLNINRVINLKHKATLNYTKLEKFTSLDTTIFNFNSNLRKESNLNIVNLDYHAKKSLNLWDFYLKEENISLKIDGIVNIDKNRQGANIANIVHEAKNISSQFNIQHILHDESKGLFEVKSTINKNAQYAKVIQSSKTTLLSDDARINAQPRLQIYTDELEARHSATTGAIDQEQLYYLKSRGIPHKKAIEMIIESFESTILNKIDNDLIKEFVKSFKGKSDVQRVF